MLDYYIEGGKGIGRRFLPSLRLEPKTITEPEIAGFDAINTTAPASSHITSLATPQPVVRVRICINTDLAFDEANFLQELQSSGLFSRHFRPLTHQADVKSTLIFASVSAAMWSLMPRGHAAIRFLGFEMQS